MLFEQVQPEVSFKVAPYGVDVVGVILRVVVFHEKRRRLNAIVVRFARLLATGPREVQIRPGFLDLLLPCIRNLFRHVIAILAQQILEKLALMRPKLPSAAYRWLAAVGKASRLYGAYAVLSPSSPPAGLAAQQLWLYASDPPPELEHGLDALRWSGQRLRALADRYHFSVVVIDWVDWPLLSQAVDTPLARQRLASARVQTAIGADSYLPEALVPGPAGVAGWDRQWVIEADRHANAAAIAVLSRVIVDRLRAINE